MLCLPHNASTLRAVKITSSMCTECGGSTVANYQLCEQCGKGFDQCQLCREPLQNPINPRKITAFNSRRAQEIRYSKLQARETFAKKKRNADKTYEICTAEYSNLARERIAPLRAACEKACRPHRDKLRAVNESLSGDSTDNSLLAIQSTLIPPRLKAALEQCDAACLSIQDKYERDIWKHIQKYRQAIKPSQSELKGAVNRAQDELNLQLRSLDRRLETLLYRSTKLRYIVPGAVVVFFKKIFSRK